MHPHTTQFVCRRPAILIASFLAVVGACSLAQDDPAASPKVLFDANPAHSAGRIVDAHATVATTPRDGGIDVVVAGSNEGYPGFAIAPAEGDAWDLSPWGHVQARLTNTGDATLSVNLRVDNAGPWQDNPWNTESVSIKPGETKVLKVIFGHHYGYKPGYKLDPSKVVRVLIFIDKSGKERSFRVEDLQAGGPAGEKPPVPPDQVRIFPTGGVMLGADTDFEGLRLAGARAQATPLAGLGVRLDFPSATGEPQRGVIRPAVGRWNLRDHLEVRVTLANVGDHPVRPSLRLESNDRRTDEIALDTPLAPGEVRTVTVPFASASIWQGPQTFPQTHVPGVGGSSFRSDVCSAVVVSADAESTERALLIRSIVAGMPPREPLPAWLGRRPPVAGDWTMTFEDTFEGDTVDLSRWNVHTPNFWDRRSYFSTNNVIVADGVARLRFERRRGRSNDEPEGEERLYATGFLDTYGKWTQRYGYFESRTRLPSAPGLWPAFWTMPDRGGDPDHAVNPQWRRASTSDGGMEFDIMEHLTRWGPNRYTTAFHWDGYGDGHRATGATVYVQPDDEGFVTAGLLWLPGLAVYYVQGREVARWEHERVCSVQSYIKYTNVSGGWDNDPLDDRQLPDDFVIDYVRVWQRSDLASPEDGPKPNDGGTRSQF